MTAFNIASPLLRWSLVGPIFTDDLHRSAAHRPNCGRQDQPVPDLAGARRTFDASGGTYSLMAGKGKDPVVLTREDSSGYVSGSVRHPTSRRSAREARPR